MADQQGPRRDQTHPAQPLRSIPASLVGDWAFAPSRVSWRHSLLRARARVLGRSAPPRFRVLVAPVPAARWNCLFLFIPDGVLDEDQRLIVQRVRLLQGKLLIVFATPYDSGSIPAGLQVANAIIWKDLPGFDFSAYALALDAVARHSPGAVAYVQNDSVLGPFGDLDELVHRARWDLTGFIATREIENHISSYAFILGDVTPARVAGLSPALSTAWCYDNFADVVLQQETRLARIAARGMSVGAFFYMPERPASQSLARAFRHRLLRPAYQPLDLRGNPSLSFPLELLNLGHPFLKKSLFTKFAGVADGDAMRERLRALGWR